MNKRPLSITILGWLLMAVGSVALFYHLPELWKRQPFDYGALWVCVVRLLAIVGGAFLLFGFDWARWLLASWMAYHIVLSTFHPLIELLTHLLLFGVIAYFLFRPQSSRYFRSRRSRSEFPGRAEGENARKSR